MKFLRRAALQQRIGELLRESPVVALLGPRQSGKTTLANQVLAGREGERFDLALADRRPLPARFLVLGSASPELLRQSSESLAGRIRFVELSGFSLDELGSPALRRLWTRGGFPPAYLARSDAKSLAWREDFILTFLERDMGALGIDVRSPIQMRRLWSMLAHRHAQLWNGAELAGALAAHRSASR